MQMQCYNLLEYHSSFIKIMVIENRLENFNGYQKWIFINYTCIIIVWATNSQLIAVQAENTVAFGTCCAQ